MSQGKISGSSWRAAVPEADKSRNTVRFCPYEVPFLVATAAPLKED